MRKVSAAGRSFAVLVSFCLLFKSFLAQYNARRYDCLSTTKTFLLFPTDKALQTLLASSRIYTPLTRLTRLSILLPSFFPSFELDLDQKESLPLFLSFFLSLSLTAIHLIDSRNYTYTCAYHGPIDSNLSGSKSTSQSKYGYKLLLKTVIKTLRQRLLTLLATNYYYE